MLHKEVMLLIQIIPRDIQRFTEPLKVYDFPFPQEPKGRKHLRIIRHIDEIFIGTAGFLLCCTVVRKTYAKMKLCSLAKKLGGEPIF